MASLSHGLCFLVGAALAGKLGWWLGGLLDHPLLGLAGAGLVVFGQGMGWGGHWRLADGSVWPPHLEDKTLPWEQLWGPALLLLPIALAGAFGAGVGWLAGAVWRHPVTGQAWGMVIGALAAWLVMMADTKLEGTPGDDHGNVHGDGRGLTLPEAEQRGVKVNTTGGIHLGYGLKEDKAENKSKGKAKDKVGGKA